MKIIISGAGIVGLATGQAFRKFGFNVSFLDVKLEALKKARDAGFETYLYHADDLTLDSDIVFICVPEEKVIQAVEDLFEITNPYEIVIRSTTFPGTTDVLAKKNKGTRFYHNPEFLRERNALEDLLLSKYTIIGEAEGQQIPAIYIEDIYNKMRIPILWTQAKVSEMVKLATNNYLAMCISFWNSYKALCYFLGINSHEVAKLAMQDPRVSIYGAINHGDHPFSGFCLPKDLTNIIKFCESNNIDIPLLKAVREVNIKMGGKDIDEHETSM